VAKFTAKGTNTNLNLNDEFSHECTNVRAFVAKFTAKGTNTNLNLNDEFSHECTNVRVQIKRPGEKYELKFERRD
jgi:hypothetical protein